MRTPPTARLTHPIVASHSGRVTHIDNRRIARLAKLAGAPDVPAAGMRLHVSLGDDIIAGQPLLTLHAQSRGEMAYAQIGRASCRGKSVSVRVDLGGRRIIKKQKQKAKTTIHNTI